MHGKVNEVREVCKRSVRFDDFEFEFGEIVLKIYMKLC